MTPQATESAREANDGASPVLECDANLARMVNYVLGYGKQGVPLSNAPTVRRPRPRACLALDTAEMFPETKTRDVIAS